MVTTVLTPSSINYSSLILNFIYLELHCMHSSRLAILPWYNEKFIHISQNKEILFVFLVY